MLGTRLSLLRRRTAGGSTPGVATVTFTGGSGAWSGIEVANVDDTRPLVVICRGPGGEGAGGGDSPGTGGGGGGYVRAEVAEWNKSELWYYNFEFNTMFTDEGGSEMVYGSPGQRGADAGGGGLGDFEGVRWSNTISRRGGDGGEGSVEMGGGGGAGAGPLGDGANGTDGVLGGGAGIGDDANGAGDGGDGRGIEQEGLPGTTYGGGGGGGGQGGGSGGPGVIILLVPTLT